MDLIIDNSYEKPIKVIFEVEKNPCPLNPSIYCEYSKIKYDDMDMIIYCDGYCKYLKEE